MKYIVTETRIVYQEVEIDDELRIEYILDKANSILGQCESGREALEDVLNHYTERYGFSYNINSCGTVIDNIELEEEC